MYNVYVVVLYKSEYCTSYDFSCTIVVRRNLHDVKYTYYLLHYTVYNVHCTMYTVHRVPRRIMAYWVGVLKYSERYEVYCV